MNPTSPIRTHAQPAPRWQRRKEARPAEILDAALDEFVTRGFAAARLEDIAKRAGCTKGTIFVYFESKQELFKAVVRANVLPLIAHAESLAEHHDGPVRDLLVKILRSRWESVVNSRLSGLPKLIFSEAGCFPDLARFYLDEVIGRGHAVIVRVLRAGIASGEFREMDADYLARVAASPMLVAALWKHSFQPHAAHEIDPQAYFETWLDLLLSGIARPPAGNAA
jgi:AcrR family transcriptional regulator